MLPGNSRPERVEKQDIIALGNHFNNVTMEDKMIDLKAIGEPGVPIPIGTKAYFRERQRCRLFDFVIRGFIDKGLTYEDIAKKLGCKPSVARRMIGAPGEWTMETVSDLMLGIYGAEIVFMEKKL